MSNTDTASARTDTASARTDTASARTDNKSAVLDNMNNYLEQEMKSNTFKLNAFKKTKSDELHRLFNMDPIYKDHYLYDIGKFNNRDNSWDFGPVVLTTNYTKFPSLPTWLQTKISPNMFTVYNRVTGRTSYHIFDHPQDCNKEAQKVYDKLAFAKRFNTIGYFNGYTWINDPKHTAPPKDLNDRW